MDGLNSPGKRKKKDLWPAGKLAAIDDFSLPESPSGFDHAAG